MIRAIKKLRDVHHSEGPLGVMALISQWWRWHSVFLTGMSVLLEAPVLQEPAASKSRLASYNVSWLEPGTFDALVGVIPDAQRERIGALFRRFQSEGARAALIWHRDRVVAYNWVFRHRYIVTFDSYASRNLVLRLPEDCVFFGNGYIDPAYRMHGLFPRLLAHSAQAFGPNLRCYSSTDVFNAISIGSHLRLGFRRIATVACITMLGHTGFHTRATGEAAWRPVANELSLTALGKPSAAAAQA